MDRHLKYDSLSAKHPASPMLRKARELKPMNQQNIITENREHSTF
jgi:hypothetical protein